MQMDIKKALATILKSERIDFKTTIIRDRKTFHNDKRINLTREYNLCKHLCI